MRNSHNLRATLVLLAALCATGAAVAAAPPTHSTAASTADEAGKLLARERNCLACHAVDKKVVGPAFTAIANKYEGQSDAENKLALKIRKGGSGVWGAIPMPSNGQVDEAEARQLAKWILELP
jgi:cytochrome c